MDPARDSPPRGTDHRYREIGMHTYTIKKHTVTFYGLAKFSIQGIVKVDYPKGSASIDASATGCSDYTYKVALDPAAGKWSASDTHAWSAKDIPVTLHVWIDKANLKTLHAEVTRDDHGSEKIWSDSFDLLHPLKPRKVEAWAQGAFGPGIEEHADHTYGIGFADDGTRQYLWPCGGDHDGKDAHAIASGTAYEPECDCLSQRLADPATKGLAGIIYGVDGVCHQATNRILCTAGIEVNGAKGYKKSGDERAWKYLTYLLYGRLGIKRPKGRDTWEKIKAGCLSKDCPHCDEKPTEYRQTAAEMGLAAAHIDAAEQLAESARVDLETIYEELSAGRLSPTGYADAMNARIKQYCDDLLQRIGEADYRAVLGEPPANPPVVVEPAICEAVFANGTIAPS